MLGVMPISVLQVEPEKFCELVRSQRCSMVIARAFQAIELEYENAVEELAAAWNSRIGAPCDEHTWFESLCVMMPAIDPEAILRELASSETNLEEVAERSSAWFRDTPENAITGLWRPLKELYIYIYIYMVFAEDERKKREGVIFLSDTTKTKRKE